ncbi:MAG: TldD/PmbA family protein [Acidimicrobiales bacterium]|nr:TldD/PmbA family protein [Acidimicrobiales bacterium]
MVAEGLVAELLSAGRAAGAEFVEVFVEDVERRSVNLDDRRIENLVSSRDRGAGIRALVGERIGFAHTSNLAQESLLEAVATATAAAVGGDEPIGGHAAEGVDSDVTGVQKIAIPPADVDAATKVALVRSADEAARAVDEAITQVSARYAETRRQIQIANSDGVRSHDDQTRTLFSVTAIASGDTGQQTGSETVGLSVGFELFDSNDVKDLARKAAERALIKVNARPAPSGSMTVVIGPGSGGVLFHEACGHGLEADLVNKGASAFAGKVGEKVASELVTIIDDGTMPDEWGRYAVDDEGRPAARNVLIENGVLKDYMWDGLRARAAGRVSSGNGRRQSYRHLPMVRMTNTYLAAGDQTPEEIIGGVDHGVYVARLGGGQVNTASGDFVFGMTEAYMIEDGRITDPIREGQLIGNGPKVLQMIDAVGNDFEMGPPGTCGKDGQGVPVGDGVPTLRVTELTIGGTTT